MTSAQAAAVDAMRAERARHNLIGWTMCACYATDWRPYEGFPDGTADEFFLAWERHVEKSVLAILLSPTKKPCAECGGKGEHKDVDPEGWTRSTDCETCHHSGFVLGPAPIEGLGWVKVSDCEPITVSNDDGAGGQFVDAEGNYESHYRPATRRVIGFRLPSKVREAP